MKIEKQIQDMKERCKEEILAYTDVHDINYRAKKAQIEELEFFINN